MLYYSTEYMFEQVHLHIKKAGATDNRACAHDPSCYLSFEWLFQRQILSELPHRQKKNKIKQQ